MSKSQVRFGTTECSSVDNIGTQNPETTLPSVWESDIDLPDRKGTFTGVFFHDTDIEYTQFDSMRTRLDQRFGCTQVFDDATEFINYLMQVTLFSETFFVMSGEYANCLIKTVLKRSKLFHAYNFQFPTDPTETEHELNNLFKTISDDIEIYNNPIPSLPATTPSSTTAVTKCPPKTHTVPCPPMTVFSSDPKQESFRYCNEESLRFLWNQTFNQYLLRLVHIQKSLKVMFDECRRLSMKNIPSMEQIHKIERVYTPSDALNYYTKDSFLFRHLNAVYRSEAPERIFIFRPYIRNLHQQIEAGHRQRENYSQRPLYRGKKIQEHVLQKLKINKGKLVSFNGFLSTTKSRFMAEIFAGVGQERAGYHSVIFEMHIDETSNSRPHASAEEVSEFPEEEEILFSTGSVWLIESVELEVGDVWVVRMRSSSETNSDVASLLEEKFPGDYNLLALGDIFHKLTNDQKTDEFYESIIEENELLDEQKAEIYCRRADMRSTKENYQDAIPYLEKAAELLKETRLPLPISCRLLFAYNGLSARLNVLYNLGNIHQRTLKYDKAVEIYMKAVHEPNGNKEEYAAVWHQLGIVSCIQRKYKQARDYHLKAVELAFDTGFRQEYETHLKSIDNLLERLEPTRLPNTLRPRIQILLLMVLLILFISFLCFWIEFPGEL